MTDGVLQKRCELLEVSAGLREKLDLKVRLLSRLDELQMTWEVSDLQGKIASTESEVSSLREQIDKDSAEKLTRKHKVRIT